MHFALAAAAAVILLPAHASVIDTTPGDGETITAQPGTISVVMNEAIIDIEGATGTNALQITDASGRFYGDGCTTVDGDTISADAPLGEAGDYTLTYQVVSADGHPVSGTIGFTFEPAAGEAGALGATEEPVCGQAAPAASAPAAAAPAETEAAATPAATAAPAAPEATASTEQGTATDAEAAADAGASWPFIAIGVLALLGVLAVIAFRTNRLRGELRERNGEVSEADAAAQEQLDR